MSNYLVIYRSRLTKKRGSNNYYFNCTNHLQSNLVKFLTTILQPSGNIQSNHLQKSPAPMNQEDILPTEVLQD